MPPPKRAGQRRESQAEARKAERERLNAMATIQPGTESPDNGGNTDPDSGSDDSGNLGD